MESFSTLEIIGALIGIIYIILEYRASVWLWAVGVVMPAIYIFICYQAGIYADMGINIYFLLAAIYGWIVWIKAERANSNKQTTTDDVLGITHTSSTQWAWCSAIFALLFALLAYILINFTPSTVPYSDSFTTALSVIGMWMLAHKLLEHWLLWIAIDAVSTVMYIEKGLYPTAILYAIYTVIAVAGYIKWRKLMANSTSAPTPQENPEL